MSAVGRPNWIGRLALLGALLTLVLIANSIYDKHRRFSRDVQSYHQIELRDGRADVLYKLGYPPNVLGEIQDGEEGRWQQVFITDGSDPRNLMTEGTDINDYPEWAYPFGDLGARINIAFDGDEVSAVSCYSPPERGYSLDCGSLFGVSVGDTEDTLVGVLGPPDRSMLDGVAKRIRYDDIGVEFMLTRSRIYMISVLAEKGEPADQQRRFLMTISPF